MPHRSKGVAPSQTTGTNGRSHPSQARKSAHKRDLRRRNAQQLAAEAEEQGISVTELQAQRSAAADLLRRNSTSPPIPVLSDEERRAAERDSDRRRSGYY